MPERENRHFDHQRMVPHLCCEVPDNGSVSRKGNNRSPIDSSYDIICIEQYFFSSKRQVISVTDSPFIWHSVPCQCRAQRRRVNSQYCGSCGENVNPSSVTVFIQYVRRPRNVGFAQDEPFTGPPLARRSSAAQRRLGNQVA